MALPRKLLIVALFAMMLSGSAARAQGGPNSEPAVVVAINQVSEISIAPGDIPNLIGSIAGDLPVITQIRFFANGELLDEGYTPSIQRKEGSYNPTMKTLTILGTMGGSPVVEELHFITHEGAVYALDDAYLDQETIQKAPGRGVPFLLKTDLASTQGQARFDASPLAALTPKAATPPPTITSVGGNSIGSGSSSITSNGKIAVGSCGAPAYNGLYVFDTVATSATSHPIPTNANWPYNVPYLTLSGINFGTTKGTIKFGSLTLNAASQVSGQPAIVSWSPTQITFVPGMPFNSSGPGLQQGASLILTVTTSTGATSPVYGVSALPSVGTRVYGQCTWYAAYERILSGKNPPDAAYPENDQYGSARWHSIDATYVPQLYDVFVWKWTDKLGTHQHTGVVVKAVQTAATKTASTWNITVGEMNYDCKSSIADLSNNKPVTSTFQVTMVNGKPAGYTWTTSTWAVGNLVPYSYYR